MRYAPVVPQGEDDWDEQPGLPQGSAQAHTVDAAVQKAEVNEAAHRTHAVASRHIPAWQQPEGGWKGGA
jgi:hypothetical protein